MLHIDGSYGEGGGQVLRTALSLSAILGRPIEIHRIRKGRDKPGLRPQHLSAVRAVARISSARTSGAELGSQRLTFEPGRVEADRYAIQIGTAGSAILVLQSILPPLLFAGKESRIRITGGTHVPWSPSFHYLKEIFLPPLEEMGGEVSTEIGPWGFYPKGGGEVKACIQPLSTLHPIERKDRGKLLDFNGFSAIANLPRPIGERQRKRALRCLTKEGYAPSGLSLLMPPSPGPGAVVYLHAAFRRGEAGFTSLGKKGKPAEQVADEACSEFLRFMDSGGAVDRHLGDQLLLFMALARGRSSLIVQSLTKHLLTNIWLLEQFLPVRFRVDEATNEVSVEGAGFSR